MRHFIVRTEGNGSAEIRLAARDDETRAMTRGDRILFYQVRGNGEAERGVFIAWGEVERVSADGESGVAHLKQLIPLKRRVPFAELRGDPRRDRTAVVQPINAEVLNLVLARAQR